MSNSLIDDVVVQTLLTKSSLTRNQFLAYLIKKGKFDQKLLKRYLKEEKIFRTRGALAGSLLQAKNNIRKSLFTILLLFYSRVWEDKERQIIVSLIEGLKKIADGPSDRKNDAVSYVIRIIENMT